MSGQDPVLVQKMPLDLEFWPSVWPAVKWEVVTNAESWASPDALWPVTWAAPHSGE